MRRDFRFPEAEEAYLDSWELPWEAVVDGNQRWLLVHDWPIPVGYNCRTATLAIMIPPSYPDASLDMVYFSPALSLVDGRAIPAIAQHQAMELTWQRWSRHYTPANPWRVGEDDLSTHLILVDTWLKRELRKVVAA